MPFRNIPCVGGPHSGAPYGAGWLAAAGRLRSRKENALDASKRTHGDLGMGALVKTAPGIDRIAFSKETAHGIERFQGAARMARQLLVYTVVEIAYDGAVKIAKEHIGTRNSAWISVLRRWFPLLLQGGNQADMGVAKQLHVLPECQVQAITAIDNCANDKRDHSRDFGSLGFRPLQCACWIAFPEIHAWSKPIVITIALNQIGVPGQSLFADMPIATVETKNERGMEASQVRGGESRIFDGPYSGATLPSSVTRPIRTSAVRAADGLAVLASVCRLIACLMASCCLSLIRT